MGPMWTEASWPALGLSDRLAACDMCHQPACLGPDMASQCRAWTVSASSFWGGEMGQIAAIPFLTKRPLHLGWPPTQRTVRGPSRHPREFLTPFITITHFHSRIPF